MEQFAQWFVNLFKDLFSNIWKGISGFFLLIYQALVLDIVDYYKDFATASKAFGIFDWFLAVISILVLIIVAGLIIFLLVLLFRRYIRFVKKEKDKESLIHEVAALNNEIANLIDEKNALVALNDTQNLPTATNNAGVKTAVNYEKIRFPLLVSVDETYRYNILPTKMEEHHKLNLKELVERFVNFSASQLGLFYTEKTVRIFFAGMATSKTMILEGISGTGKTSLAYAMGKFFQNDAAIISVQPSWRDRNEMIGYFNEFTKKYNETDFLKALYETTYRTDPNFIVLDEMNLSRVEYYFADFLSMLEMPDPNQWQIRIVADEQPGDPAHFKDGKLLVPQNVWFIGTANRDDSTFAITDKVYDRAASIEINEKAVRFDAPYTEGIKMSGEYLQKLYQEAIKEYKISQKTLENLTKLDKYITEKFQIAFGNRINKQIHQFLPVYVAAGGDEQEALDYMVSRKIIRKFETLNLPFLRAEIEELIEYIDKLFGKNNFTDSKKMLHSFIKQL